MHICEYCFQSHTPCCPKCGCHVTDDEQQGFYMKYRVERNGGTPGKHDKCTYFVLDLIHDAYAKAALEAYANACRNEYPLLAMDLDKLS